MYSARVVLDYDVIVRMRNEGNGSIRNIVTEFVKDEFGQRKD
jgi:hypothetical protein